MIKISRLHQDTISRLYTDSRWTYKTIEGYVRKERGYNARTLQVLRRAGLVESRLFTGPRGGRIVGIRLTEAGQRVAVRIDQLAEGNAPLAQDGNMSREVIVGVINPTTFTLEY